MATLTNPAAVQALAYLRDSKIKYFDEIFRQAPEDLEKWDLDSKKARKLLIYLSNLGETDPAGLIDPTDLLEVNQALLNQGQSPDFSEQQVINLVSEFHKKFKIEIPVRLSPNRLWEPEKTGSPDGAELRALEDALTLTIDNQVISFDEAHKVMTIKRAKNNHKAADTLLSFLQASGLTDKRGLVLTHIEPEEVKEIQASFRYDIPHQGFKADGKTVIYKIFYKDKDLNRQTVLEVEVKPSEEYIKNPDANRYLRALSIKTKQLVTPKLKL